MSAGARLDAARARAFGGGAAAYGAVACPTAAAAARTSVVACSGAVEMKADSIVTDVQTFFFLSTRGLVQASWQFLDDGSGSLDIVR